MSKVNNDYLFLNNETSLTINVETPGTLSDLIFDAGFRPAYVAQLVVTGTLDDTDFTCIHETMTSLVDVDLSGITNTDGVNFNGKSKLRRIILPKNLTSLPVICFTESAAPPRVSESSFVRVILSIPIFSLNALATLTDS